MVCVCVCDVSVTKQGTNADSYPATVGDLLPRRGERGGKEKGRKLGPYEGEDGVHWM